MFVEVFKGWVFSKKHNYMTTVFERIQEEVVSVPNSGLVLELSMKIDPNFEIFMTKRFKTVMHIISFLGGLSNGVGLVFLFLVMPIREILYYKKLIDDTFNVCYDDEQLYLGLELMQRTQTSLEKLDDPKTAQDFVEDIQE